MNILLGFGGKRPRPTLVLLGAEMFSGVNEQVIQAAKVIDTYILQHFFTMM
ncbi:MAG: hypothetical protein CM1200mP28_01160 [Deltaproteobacteria bacterium]|nr:MAG: hypothetical protein CM1200mP28_01160 [Deltaproteobacteria bacterium]